MKFKSCLLAILWPALHTLAQSPIAIRPLTVGDTAPDIVFSNVVNNPVSKIHLSQFKDQLVILDFWATWCGSCIAKLNTIDSLQQAFPGKLKIILVNNLIGTGDTKETITAFFSRWNKKHPAFRSTHVAEDTLAAKYFPHIFLPHYIWIAPGGRIIAITDGEALTAANISMLVSGIMPHLPLKTDKRMGSQ
ncbi:TlpA family protein disulfide reductase [Terrimonas pollutisoli]|uniref:TlpA family protein disulfide reductase n=1 Tax=Terrimonas pollutisoli TaxID=3034147 RepID=UPI0023EE0E5C|nr:TlpA disulfide reductase family protein [Terrimonas sp. H1YJ31]